MMKRNGWYMHGEKLIETMKSLSLPTGQIALWYLGQAGIVIKHQDTLMCVDPFLKEGSFRSFEPPFTPEQGDFFDYILCTHNHSDHLDQDSLRRIASVKPNTKYVFPKPHFALMESFGIESKSLIGAAAGEEIILSEGIKVIPFPAAHEEFYYDKNGNLENLGYIIETPCATIYHSGDTVEWETMTEELSKYSIDIMCLPINGSDWKRKKSNIIGNLDSREAADIFDTCNGDLLIPLHYDLFRHNGENPAHLVDYMHYDHPGKKFHIMSPGECFIYMPLK